MNKPFDIDEVTDDTMMTKSDVADYLNIGETSVWKLFNYPGFPFIQIGRKRMVRYKDLCEFLERSRGRKVDINHPQNAME